MIIDNYDYSSLTLNFFSAMVSNRAVMLTRMMTSFITSLMPTPIIISLRMASI